MSLARKSSFPHVIQQGLFGSSNKLSNKTNSLSLSTQVKLIVLAGLSYLQSAQAAYSDTTYALEPATNTNFQIDYNAAELPEMKSRLMEFCNMIIYSTPQAAYVHAATPQCESDTGVLGPMANVAVEAGKNITQSFMSCFGKGMQGMCDEYFDGQNNNTGSGASAMTTLIVIGSIFLVVASVVAIYACCNSNCRRRTSYNNDSYKPLDSVSVITTPTVPAVSSSNYSTFSSGNSSRYYNSYSSSTPVYTPPPVVVVVDTYPSRSSMPEPAPVVHHDHSHHSSVVWHP